MDVCLLNVPTPSSPGLGTGEARHTFEIGQNNHTEDNRMEKEGRIN